MTEARRWTAAILLGFALAGGAAAPGAAADSDGERARAEEMAREAMEQLLRAIELFLQSIPQYEMPEVTEDGDIIIRRKRWRDDKDEPAKPEVDETST